MAAARVQVMLLLQTVPFRAAAAVVGVRARLPAKTAIVPPLAQQAAVVVDIKPLLAGLTLAAQAGPPAILQGLPLLQRQVQQEAPVLPVTPPLLGRVVAGVQPALLPPRPATAGPVVLLAVAGAAAVVG